MEIEHQAPAHGHRGFFRCLHGGPPPPLSQKKHKGCKPPCSFIQPPRSIFPVLHRCFRRRHHIDRLATNATVPSTRPTCHLGGGACGTRANSNGFSRAFCAMFGGSRFVGSRSWKQETNYVSTGGACHRRATFLRRSDVLQWVTITTTIFWSTLKAKSLHCPR
uniref:Uncharacterized protein n=1 Tax=Opuntia streptacantha TaxID=393608 RepID=A0A7C9DPJ1_OPUST